jgi:hypothetical protein
MKDETSTIAGMHQTRRQDTEQGYDEDGVIDLSEYIAVVIKRKNIVLGVFAGVVLVSGIKVFTAPKLYEVSALIGPPVGSVTESGAPELDSVGNIKAAIDSGAFDEKIVNNMKVDEGSLNFSVSQPKDSKILKISMSQTADKTDLGKKMVTALIGELNLSYAKFIEDKQSRIKNQIRMAQSGIVRKENDLKLKDAQFKVLADREQQCMEDLKAAKGESDKILAGRMPSAEQNGNKDTGTSLLLITAIQQSISYLSQLKTELSEARIKKESLVNAIENLKSAIGEDQIGIENLKMSRDAMHNIVVVQEPLVSSRPIGAGKARLMMLATGMAGLIAGLFAAFVIEYWKNFAV